MNVSAEHLVTTLSAVHTAKTQRSGRQRSIWLWILIWLWTCVLSEMI